MRVSNEVLSVLDRAACEGNALSLVALGKLDRPLYVATDKVLKAAGGKWNTKRAAHLFDGDAASAIEPILLTGEVTSIKQELQQFDTPEALAREIVARARIRPGMSVLEPSAGLGALALAAGEAGGVVSCVEVDAGRYRKLDALVGTHGIQVATQGDFLAVPVKPTFERVIMNPPFSRRQDIRHVRHAIGWLKPGGRLVAIMAASLTYSTMREVVEFREHLARFGATIEDLPPNSFKASGTGVNAVVVTLDT